MKTPRQKAALIVSLVAFGLGVFLLTLIGCAHNPYGPPRYEGVFVFEQPIYQPAYVGVTLQAARDWEKATDSDIFRDGNPVFVIQRPGRVEYQDGWVEGVAHQGRRTIVLSAAAQMNVLYPIVAHELGHIIGITDHSDNPADLMAAQVLPGRTITLNDAARAREVLR